MYKINSSPKTYINKQVVKNLASAGQTVNLYAIWSGGYSCSTGILTYDSTYGASSGGYICVTSGSSSSSCSYYSSCLGGYTSDLGAKKESDCYINVPGGMKITTAGSSELKSCTGYGARYMPAHKVYYGNVTQGEVAGECLRCPDGQQANNNFDGCITCHAGYYCPGFVVVINLKKIEFIYLF